MDEHARGDVDYVADNQVIAAIEALTDNKLTHLSGNASASK